MQNDLDPKGLEAALDARVGGACSVMEHLDFTAEDAKLMGVHVEGENFAALDVVRHEQWREAGRQVISTAIRAYLSATVPAGDGDLVERLMTHREQILASRDGFKEVTPLSADLLEAASRLSQGTEGWWPSGKFNFGARVEKIKGAAWHGRVCGWYTTALTPVGYAVESEREPGSVQIYPEAALKENAL